MAAGVDISEKKLWAHNFHINRENNMMHTHAGYGR